MAKDKNHCEKLVAALELLLPVLSRLTVPEREGRKSVLGRREFIKSSAIKAEEISPEGRGGEGNKSDLQKIEDIIPQIKGRGGEGNKSDLQKIEDIIPQITELMANLLITNGEGEIDRQQMRRMSVKLGKLSTKLLEVSLDGGEISEDSIQKKLLRYEIDAILREVI